MIQDVSIDALASIVENNCQRGKSENDLVLSVRPFQQTE